MSCFVCIKACEAVLLLSMIGSVSSTLEVHLWSHNSVVDTKQQIKCNCNMEFMGRS